MGAGGRGDLSSDPPASGVVEQQNTTVRSKRRRSPKDDLLVLKSLWLSRANGKDHAERLEAFYGPQAKAYDGFRTNFLWGRKPMLAACAARLEQQRDMIWVDLGGGTGENVDLMATYLPLDRFKAIYVVDLCRSLCQQAEEKVAAKGWSNVHVVEGDACTWQLPVGKADLVTFSYSLSMIPPFYVAVENAISWLHADRGLMGVADFFVSSKHDLPLRQMNWLRRFFWRATFDTDNIDIGPERRAYLDHRLSRAWEMNGQGSIPYVPVLRAPFYVWVGRPRPGAGILTEARVEAPPCFPPTFLYTQSWEDPRADMQVLSISSDDNVLTLTSGGCNALNLLIHGAGHVVSVDCNPAQSALLELKATAIRRLDFEDVWALFGEGRHPHMEQLFERQLAPWLSQTSHAFWKSRLSYFRTGLYFHGGMGQVIYYLQLLTTFLGLRSSMHKLVSAESVEEQAHVWDSLWPVRFFKTAPAWLVRLATNLLAVLLFNRFVLWFGGGVPCKQYRLIQRDGVCICKYAARTFDTVARTSHLRHDNYFYYNCLTGRYARDNCPSYLQQNEFAFLKKMGLDRLEIVTGTFLDQLRSQKFTKVVLMDHMDWLDAQAAQHVAAELAAAVPVGGRIIWRSAALVPPYNQGIAAAGFQVQCLAKADQGYMDRVNMYSSFYMGTRV